MTIMTGYVVSGVYVRPHLQRNGYGRHMIRLMHHVLAPPSSLPAFPEAWGAPPLKSLGDAALSALYSDVGDFYASCGPSPSEVGWKATDRRSTTWRVSGQTPSLSTQEGIRLLDDKGLKDILAQDEVLILQELQHGLTGDRTRFTFLPADGPLNFQIQLFKLSPNARPFSASHWPPTAFGAQAVSLDSPQLAFAAWTFEVHPAPMRLIITRMRCDENSLAKLVNAALDIAVQTGMEQVEVWNLPKELVNAASRLGGITCEREDHWPAVKWYGSPSEEVEWINNEK